jgi:hypothetical protein
MKKYKFGYKKFRSWITFREEVLLNGSESAKQEILELSVRLRNICLIQGLSSDGIQTTVRSRNCRDFDETIDTALEEERALVSEQDRSGAKETHCVGVVVVVKQAT